MEIELSIINNYLVFKFDKFGINIHQLLTMDTEPKLIMIDVIEVNNDKGIKCVLKDLTTSEMFYKWFDPVELYDSMDVTLKLNYDMIDAVKVTNTLEAIRVIPIKEILT